MKPKPTGAKFRNLTAFRESVYYSRTVNGRRYWVNFKTQDWGDAALMRERFEEQEGVEMRRGDVPRLRAFAQRYLAEDTDKLAATTVRERKRQLGERGFLMPHLGEKRLDEITPEMLRQWWALEMTKRVTRERRQPDGTRKEVEGPKRATQTGKHYLDALSAVYEFAIDVGFSELENPVEPFRKRLRRKNRTKRGRSDARRDRHIRPIERPEELARLVESADTEGLVARVVVLLQLDAGLRVGEAMALRWGKVAWGQDEEDRSRSLYIDENLPSGGTGQAEETKSGKPRKVGLSRRLRAALGDLYLARFEGDPGAYSSDLRVLEGVDPDNFRVRAWRAICTRADLGWRAMKDLRDTYASQLLTAGVQLGYVSRQLGHATPVVTTDHYAKWCGGDDYRDPVPVEEGELPSDLLARIAEKVASKSHQAEEATPTGTASDFPKDLMNQELTLGELGSGGGIRTPDLRVMSPTSYQTALPRNKIGAELYRLTRALSIRENGRESMGWGFECARGGVSRVR